MQLSKGVEWAAHSVALMAALPQDAGLSREVLAEYHEVPAAYLAKHLQALSKAGIVTATRGAQGGYRLARAPSEISLWDITAAVDGVLPMFRCTEIRQKGPCALLASECKLACPIAAAFLAAEAAWRKSLASITIADIAVSITQSSSQAKLRRVMAWVQANQTRRD